MGGDGPSELAQSAGPCPYGNTGALVPFGSAASEAPKPATRTAARSAISAHTYCVRRCTELVEVMSASFRRAVESGELKPGTDVVELPEETAAVMDGLPDVPEKWL